MTDPTERLAAVRRGLDAAAQAATAADEGVWWPTHPVGAAWDFIAAWSPSHVTAVVGSLRTICDGIEGVLARHRDMGTLVDSEATGECLCCADYVWPCPDYNAAVSVIAGLAAVWAPTTEGENDG